MTPVEQRVLEGLATFRFLTRQQMHRIGVGRDSKHLGDMLRRLVNMGMVGKMRFGVYPGLGKLAAIYYLKSKGAKALARYLRDDPARFPYTKGTPHFEADYFHRRYCVDFHIALSQWAGAQVAAIPFYVPYYASGKGRDGSTRLDLPDGKHFRPDALFCVEREPGHKELYTFEMCMNKRGKDAHRIVGQLETHREAFFEGALGDRFGIPESNVALFVSEHSDGLQAACSQVAADLSFRDCANWFWFNSTGQVHEDFASGWHDLTGQPVSF